MIAKTALAVRALLGRPVRVLSQRGTWLIRSDAIPVLVTLHPSALLRGPLSNVALNTLPGCVTWRMPSRCRRTCPTARTRNKKEFWSG